MARAEALRETTQLSLQRRSTPVGIEVGVEATHAAGTTSRSPRRFSESQVDRQLLSLQEPDLATRRFLKEIVSNPVSP